MPIYAIQVSDQYFQDPNNFEIASDEKQGTFAKNINITSRGADKCKSTLSFLSSVTFLSLTAFALRAKESAWGVLTTLATALSADATYRYSRAVCNPPSSSRFIFTTENCFSTSSVIGAFPDDFIEKLKKGERQRTSSFFESAERSKIRSNAVSAANLLEGEPQGFLPCFDRLCKVLWMKKDPGARFSELSYMQFEVNPNRRTHKRQPTILYLVSNEPIENVFNANEDDAAIMPSKNEKLKLYKNLTDAIDSYKHTVAESKSTLRYRKR